MDACIVCGLCIEVCPTDAIKEKNIFLNVDGYEVLKDNFIYINPDDCIECGNCEPACPMQAIDVAGGGSTPNPGNNGGGTTNPNTDITNELKDYPCAQQLVNKLPNLNNSIAKLMKTAFQNNSDVNIRFRAKSGLGDVDGTTFASHTNMGTFNAVININDDVLKYATQEYILVTLYHEVLHAFLDYEKYRLGNEAFQDQYPNVIVGADYDSNGIMINRYTFLPEHGQLGPYLNELQSIILALNPALPPDIAMAMAKTGITKTTPQESALNKAERNTSSGGHKGTKC